MGCGLINGYANHVITRVKKATDEYCDDEDDVREMLVQTGYIS